MRYRITWHHDGVQHRVVVKDARAARRWLGALFMEMAHDHYASDPDLDPAEKAEWMAGWRDTAQFLVTLPLKDALGIFQNFWGTHWHPVHGVRVQIAPTGSRAYARALRADYRWR